MINRQIIFRILGSLLFIEAGLMMLSMIVSFIYQEHNLLAFLYAILVACAIGGIFKYLGRNAQNHMSRRDGYIVVSVAWVVFSLIGMLPYIFSGFIPNITNAFFETMSGFTTTGASILNNIEEASHGILFWRSMTHWIGGLGIVFFTIAILPIFGLGEVKLFAAEATGPTHDKLHPRISTTAKRIWTVYSGITLACAGALMLGGMSFYDSICHAMACTSTGGFSTYQDSIAHFHSAYIEYVITFFMFISGVNFTLLYYSFWLKHVKRFFLDSELRWYISLILLITAVCTYSLVTKNGYDIEHAFRSSIFEIVSIMTTTGFMVDDYSNWQPVLWPLICLVMLVGGCAGSTSGGMKVVRINMLTKIAYNEFRHILHPNAVLPVRVNATVVNNSIKTTLLAFFFMFVVITFIGCIIFLFLGLGFKEAIGVSLSSISNVGPAFGMFGPANSWSALPDAAKWISALMMLIGRLEVFSVLMLLTPQFWRKR